MLNEPLVALTDFGLAMENAAFALLLCKLARRSRDCATPDACVPARWFALFFAFAAMSSAIGGFVHGFLINERTLAFAALWRLTLVAIGAAALAGANAAADLDWPAVVRRAVTVVMAVGFFAYCMVVVFVSQDFAVTMYIYLPGSLFLLVSFVRVFTRRRRMAALWGAVGMLMTFVAAGVQQSSASVAGLGLDHNSLYHLVQALALALVYVAASRSTGTR